MNNISSLNSLLTNYICSLLERTRSEYNGLKIGFDWIIYKLALARNWLPIRLPFYRDENNETIKTKTEPEFGIDLSFILPSKEELWIFVLKDESLTYSNWTKHNFDKDLRLASSPNLKQPELSKVKKVNIVLAYNKDEDARGVEVFDLLVSSLPTIIHDKIDLKFERWNLTKIVEEVKQYLITPDLLPQHLSEHFRYICLQIKDFNFGTEQWESQLVNNWKSFLNILLSDFDERKTLLVPVVLSIAYNYRKDTPDSYSGWIDLVEWAMLALWSYYKELPKRGAKKTKEIIVDIWLNFYITELEKYILSIESVLTTQHAFSINKIGPGFGISPINDAYLAYWHLGRLGILTLAPQDFQANGKSKEDISQHDKFIHKLVERSADWVVKCLQLNPGTLRPLLDLNHIEIFLIWVILYQAGRIEDIYGWLSELEARLLMRRAKMNINIPFIESHSRMDLVAEYAATGQRPYNYSDSSSYLLLMILEICFSLPEKQRDELIDRYMNRLIKGIDESGETIKSVKEEGDIDLVSWVPPEDWAKRVLEGPVLDGIAITTGNFERLSENTIMPLSERIKQFVNEVREKYPWEIPQYTPIAVYILACIKNKSPLPPEFWRGTIFPDETNNQKLKKDSNKETQTRKKKK